jgi:uncharacterized repeat protein (TIGR03803 family)
MLVAASLVSVALATRAFGGTRDAPASRGWRETVLHRFSGDGSGSRDGGFPAGPLIFGPAGVLYGTTYEGGSLGVGTAFSLAPTGRTAWHETLLHTFTNSGDDGGGPQSGLQFGPSGVLYGTTLSGGVFCHSRISCSGGTVFSLTPPSPARHHWSEHVLVSFYSEKVGGDFPVAGVILDPAGALFGVTEDSLRSGGGTAFELTQSPSGWSENVLHAFPAFQLDGYSPAGDIIADASGALYGTTIAGGKQRGVGCVEGCGTVFKLSRGHGRWSEELLHSFSGANGDGSEPFAGLLMGASGALFGTTYQGGDPKCSRRCGIVYELQPPANRGGSWTETILHAFSGHGGDGTMPMSRLVQDASGALYGTTVAGGSYACGSSQGCGTVFKLTPPAEPDGAWKESILYRFRGTHGDGWDPTSRLTFGPDGSLYGTTFLGGLKVCSNGCGTVFKLSPR